MSSAICRMSSAPHPIIPSYPIILYSLPTHPLWIPLSPSPFCPACYEHFTILRPLLWTFHCHFLIVRDWWDFALVDSTSHYISPKIRKTSQVDHFHALATLFMSFDSCYENFTKARVSLWAKLCCFYRKKQMRFLHQQMRFHEMMHNSKCRTSKGMERLSSPCVDDLVSLSCRSNGT